MSNQPLSKRLKCGGGGDEEEAEIIAFGGPMYDEATARKILKEVVLVSAEYAEDGEAVIGFDPDDAALDNFYYIYDGNFAGDEITPMIYFAGKGDAKMCCYLVSRGASTTKSWEDDHYCPMYAAAQESHLEVCDVLYANGAQNDVRRSFDDEGAWTPFQLAALTGRDEVVQWLVLHGTLCANDSSEGIQRDVIYPRNKVFLSTREDKTNVSGSCERLIEWAKEVTQSHSALVIFLCGALPPAPGTDQSRTLQCLSGHPGVRKHIGDFVGLEVTKRKHLRILRSVVDVLPSFI